MTTNNIIRGWKAIARRLGVSVSTVKRLKGLPVRRLGGIYILEKDLVRYLNTKNGGSN